MWLPPERRGAAISIVLAGVPLANLLGVPFGAAIGHWLGWRASFWGIAGLGAIAFVAIALTLPKVQEKAEAIPSWRAQIGVLFRHQISLSYLTLFTLLIGVLAFVTFQVPFLITMTGVPEASTPPYLFAYGLGAIIGIFVGGRLSDWKLMPAMLGSTIAYVAISAITLVAMHSPIAMFAVMTAARRHRLHLHRAAADPHRPQLGRRADPRRHLHRHGLQPRLRRSAH